MAIVSIGYVAMEAKDPAAWGAYGEAILGARACADGDRCLVRLDARGHRIAVHPGADGRLRAVGWELQSRDDFAAMLDALETADVAVHRGTPAEARARGVEAVATLADPGGNPVELFYGHRVPAAPFVSPLGVPRLALGHVVLGVPDLAAAERFYTAALGLRVSDYMDFERGGQRYSLVFLHAADGRHHSLALAGGMAGIHHVMVETAGIDEVGRGLDRCRDGGVPLRVSLGRHSNDRMLSFYMNTPNGVVVELGADGITVDDATWQVTRLETPSEWGHVFVG